MQTFTITFGDQAENHVGMQKIGQQADTGFTLDDLEKAKIWFESKGIECSLVNLKSSLLDEATPDVEIPDAYLLIAHAGLNCLLGPDHNTTDFFKEQEALPKDTKAFMCAVACHRGESKIPYGRVVNKHARHNLCFGSHDQEPDYEKGQGRIIAFHHTPLLEHLRQSFPEILGVKGKDLVAEGNYYYDIKKCGIGYHGDTERYKVIGIRVGASLPLRYLWYYKGVPIGPYIEFILDDGDIYIMSEKTTGRDWKKRNIMTLRHAAGADKFINKV